MEKKETYGKQLRKLKQIQAIYNNPTLKAAYKELHPNANDATAEVNGHKMLTADVFEGVKALLQSELPTKTNKDFIERVLIRVVAQWLAGGEKTADAISAVRELARLVPEFSDKLQIEDISKASESEIDEQLRTKFRINPN